MKLEEIKELVLLFDSTQSTKLHIQRGDFVLKLEKGHATKVEPQTIMVQAPLVQKDNDDDIAPLPKKEGDTLTSPMVGTFYRSPSPGSAAYVQVGDKVKKGQTLAIIEAMKIMNEIEAEYDCKILEIVPADAQPVEYGEVLFIVERL